MSIYYPININIKGRRCVIIGGGKVAERKAKRLLDYGADVKLVSPQSTAGLKQLAKKGKIAFIKRPVRISDIKDAYLVISAASDRKINSLISNYCKKRHILVNVVDSPRECSFILPSILRRSDLNISISTGGLSPALSKKIRKDLQKTFGKEYAGFLRIMRTLRPAAIARLKDTKKRAAFFKRALKPDIFALLKQNKIRQAKEKLEQLLKNG